MSDAGGYDLNSIAVQTHLQIYQNILARMASNSSSAKTWCVTVVTAILVLLIERKDQYALPIAAIPIILFSILDVYYLSLEKRFRRSYSKFVEVLHSGKDQAGVRVFEVLPDSNVARYVFDSVFSVSVFPFYGLIFVLVFLLGKLA